MLEPCPHNPIIKKDLKKITINVKESFFRDWEKILIIRNDLIWDLCFIFPSLLYLMNLWLDVDVLTWPRNTKLFNVLFKNQTAIKEKVVNIHHEDFVWYRQEKTSYILRIFLAIKYILNWDFFKLFKAFWQYDVIVDLVGKRRYQFVMFLVRLAKKLVRPVWWIRKKVFTYWIYKSISYKFLDWYFGFSDFDNVMNQYLEFIKNIIKPSNNNEEISNFKSKYPDLLKTIWLEIKSNDYILVHPWFGGETSRKRKAENRIGLIKKLQSKWENIKLIYWPMEKKYWEQIAKEIRHLEWIEIPDTSDIKNAINLIANCKYYIWLDSWFWHIADIFLKPWLLLFSRENPDWLWWRNDKMKAICNYKSICLKRNCPFDYCINLIEVNETYQEVVKSITS